MRPSAFTLTKPSLRKQADFDELERLSKDPKVIAWGEIGLDYFYDHSPREVQQRVFVQQMEMARAAKLPIIIHNRPSDNSENAWDDLFRLLREHWASSGLGGVLHCFTGSVEHARAALDLGFMISFAGNITYPKAQNIRDAAAMAPLDRIFIETDSPYLAPVPHRGKRNEPAFVVEVGAADRSVAKAGDRRDRTPDIGEFPELLWIGRHNRIRAANPTFAIRRVPPLRGSVQISTPPGSCAPGSLW